ncbi:MAG: Hpt domain-containing protein [Rhodobacteraceae bacterium]|nr:Hpt domain-containing protein [Paracoccaceae bacterium]
MIHWGRVNELREEVGAEDFDEVVELFLEEVEEVIDRLRQEVDLSQLEQDLHFLKGSALSLGFADFSDLCHHGEKKSADGHADTVDLSAIITGFSKSKTQFIAELPIKLTD